jgi:hypothetical protein
MIRPVRFINQEIENVQGVDIDQCYLNIVNNRSYTFPKQDGTEKTEFFKKGDKIKRHGFYYCTFKSMSEIERALYPSSGWLYGDVILIRKMQNRLDIKYKMVTTLSRNGMGQTKHIYDDVTQYTGYLASTRTMTEQVLKCDGLESEALYQKYKETSLDRVTIPAKKKDEVKICSERFLKKSGMYAYMAIVSYARLRLNQVYDELHAQYPDAKIHKVFTDSITFNHKIGHGTVEVEVTEKIRADGTIKRIERPIEFNKLLMKKYGFTVKYERSVFKWNHTDFIIQEPKIDIREITEYTDIKELLKLGQSFVMNARGGYGKTHMIINEIIPYLQKNNKKFIISSASKESALKLKNELKDIPCEVIHQLLQTNEATLSKIKSDISDIEYLIIDECSLLEISILNLLEYCKTVNPNLKIILSGDINQCDFILNMSDSLMNSYLFNNLIDFNVFTIKWHKKARYSKDYDEFLNKLLTFSNGGRDEECIEYIRYYFGDQVKQLKDKNKDKNKIKLSWTNTKRKQLTDDDISAYTVHKAQGKTIDEEYSIYQANYMMIKVLYTALSRCSDPRLISIYL